nr:ABC transporter substrate-binding protein [Candidatus Frankia alpina]
MIPDPGEHRNVFGYSRPLSQLPVSSGWGEFIAAKGGKRAVTISVELSAATTTLAGISAQSLRAAGVDVVTNLQVPAGAFDAARFAQQLRAAGADSLIAFVPAQTYYQIVVGARAAGVNLTVALGNLATYDRSALDSVGAAAAGAYSFLDYAPFELNTAAHRRFLAAMAAYSPQAASVPDGSTLIGWITTDLLLEGIKAAGLCPTWASVLTGLRAQTHYDAGGLLPAPIDLSKGMGNIAPCYDYVQVNLRLRAGEQGRHRLRPGRPSPLLRPRPARVRLAAGTPAGRQERKSTARRSGPVSSTMRKPATRLRPTPMCTVPSKSPASA